MSADSATAAGRTAAEQIQSDTCTITRAGSGPGVFDPATGVTTPPPPITVYTGQCRIRTLALQDRPVTAGEHDYTVQDVVVSLPTTASAVRVDDIMQVVASRLDPSLVGRRYIVGPVARGSQLTARRLLAREVTS